jgi:very-short-patch-repair endonuclease
MNSHNNSLLTANAQKLRKSMTKEERKLWYDCLKKLPVSVNRQKVFGKYILDFYCASVKTAIELDGSQHYETEGREKDMLRDAYLKKNGITVLRYSNRDVNVNFDVVCEDIYRHLIRQPNGCHLPLKGKA